MLTFQSEAGFGVIERLGIPAHNLEVLAIVLGMATDTILGGSGRRQDGSVVASARSYSCCDVLMALQAAQLRRTGRNLVTTDASSWTVPLTVRPRERPRTYLREQWPREHKMDPNERPQ